MDTIRMTHPDLPGQEYQATSGQVPHLQANGWQPIPEQAEQGEQWPDELRRFGGQRQVRMTHPDVDGPPITVAETAAPIHEQRGWVRVDDEPAVDAQDVEAEELAAGDDPRTVEDLKAEIRALNETRDPDDRLPVSGTKAELLDRIRTADTTMAEQRDQAPAEPDEEGA